jgi:IclR family transcriptional regulator, KDG regulon repressor
MKRILVNQKCPVEKKHVRALERGISILTLLRDKGELSLTDISTALTLNKSTTLRLLGSLLDQGLVEQVAGSHKYHLGLECLTYGRKVTSELSIRRVAFSHLEALQRLSGESVTLAVLHGRKALPIEKLYGQNQWIRLRIQGSGTSMYLHCTGLGKAMLAYMTEAEFSNIYETMGLPRQTDNTLTTLESVQLELAKTRERGYALDNSENIDGLCCIAMPLFGRADTVAGAISVSFPASVFSEATYLPIVPPLRKACMDVSQSIGAGDCALVKLAGWQTANPQLLVHP